MQRIKEEQLQQKQGSMAHKFEELKIEENPK